MAEGQPEANEERTSPLAGQVALLVAFAVILVASIFTVLVPELANDGEESDAREAPEGERATE